MRNDLLRAVGANPDSQEPVAAADPSAVVESLKVAYRRHVLNLAARDLAEDAALEDVAAELADLAGATLEAALAIARAGLRADAEPCRLAVIGLGKCGGRELNYVSDVDVVFVAEPVAGGNEQAARFALNTPPRGPSGKSTLGCDRKAAMDRWCGRFPATSPTTSDGQRRGSSKP